MPTGTGRIPTRPVATGRVMTVIGSVPTGTVGKRDLTGKEECGNLGHGPDSEGRASRQVGTGRLGQAGRGREAQGRMYGSTTPCRMTGVTLHRVVSPEGFGCGNLGHGPDRDGRAHGGWQGSEHALNPLSVWSMAFKRATRLVHGPQPPTRPWTRTNTCLSALQGFGCGNLGHGPDREGRAHGGGQPVLCDILPRSCLRVQGSI